MSVPEGGRTIARHLLETGAVTVTEGRPFMLAAGWASPVYVDCRRLVGDPTVRRGVTAIAARAVSDRFPPGHIEVVVGAEPAGIPFAAWLADALDLPFAYVRERPSGIGRNAQVEGTRVDGRRVLLVDDLTTEGSGKVAFARGLRAAGALIADILTIFDNALFPGSADRLAAEGLTLLALAGWDDVVAIEWGLSKVERSVLEGFRADPTAWSTRHGGRGAVQRRPTDA